MNSGQNAINVLNATPNGARTTRRARRIDGRIYEVLRELVVKGWNNGAEVHRELQRRFPTTAAEVVPIPDLRTIQRVLCDLTPSDGGSLWSLAEAEPEDAALIVPVLAAMIEDTEGRRPSITRTEARWIAKIRRIDLAEPGEPLDHITTYELAFEAAYAQSSEARALKAEDALLSYIEGFLAFAPWRSKKREQNYYSAFEKGWLGSRFMVYPRIYFTNEGWPEPLPAGYVEREQRAIRRRYRPTAGEGRGKTRQTVKDRSTRAATVAGPLR